MAPLGPMAVVAPPLGTRRIDCSTGSWCRNRKAGVPTSTARWSPSPRNRCAARATRYRADCATARRSRISGRRLAPAKDRVRSRQLALPWQRGGPPRARGNRARPYIDWSVRKGPGFLSQSSPGQVTLRSPCCCNSSIPPTPNNAIVAMESSFLFDDWGPGGW